MSNGVVLPAEVDISIMQEERLFKVALVSSAITVNKEETVPVIEVYVVLGITWVVPVEILGFLPRGCRADAGLRAVEAIVRNAGRVHTVTPATPLEMNYGFVHAITIALRVVQPSRSAV